MDELFCDFICVSFWKGGNIQKLITILKVIWWPSAIWFMTHYEWPLRDKYQADVSSYRMLKWIYWLSIYKHNQVSYTKSFMEIPSNTMVSKCYFL